jgi:uncharacterized protein YbjT (DUF2867 family)
MTSTKQGILIVGATGPTGSMVSKHLRDQEQHVVALLRSDDRRAEFEELGIRVVRGDAMDRDSVFAAVADAATDCDTLVNLLGGNPFQPPESWPDGDGVINTTDAAVAAGIKRYLLVTSVGTGESWQYVPEDAYIRPILALKSKAEEHLKQTDLDWNILKPGGLGPPGYEIKTGDPLITENHGVRGLIDRTDLVAVILRALASPKACLHRELYAVVDRIQTHAGEPEPYPLP